MPCKRNQCAITEEVQVECCSMPKPAKRIAEQLGVEQCFIPITEDKTKVVNLTIDQVTYEKWQKHCKPGETVEGLMAMMLDSMEM